MITTPIGTIAIDATARGLSGINLVTDSTVPKHTTTKHTNEQQARGADDFARRQHIRAVERALGAYFEGARDAFRDLPLDPAGTPFQRAVWDALRTIPYGETISYRALAKRIGNPAAVRAVGLANGRNPLPIVVPCHRVIGADGSLTGFGLGIDVKAWLLVHEGAAEPFAAPVSLASRVTRHSLRY